MDSAIDRCYEECRELLSIAERGGELSLVASSTAIIQKHFAICIASHFEKVLCESIEAYFQTVSGTHIPAVSFAKNKAISRQYHTWFNWDGNNANCFFGLFGEGFKHFMKERAQKDSELDEAIRSFIELGRSRNELVHRDLALTSFDNTLDELFAKYKSACSFVDLFPNILHEYVASTVDEVSCG